MMEKYKIVLEILGVQYKSEGATVEEALLNLPLTWEEIKGKGTLTLSFGKLKHEHLFNLRQLKRIFVNKIFRAWWAKNLEYLLSNY